MLTNKIIDSIEPPKRWKHRINMYFVNMIKNIRNNKMQILYIFKTKSVEYSEERFYNIKDLIEGEGFKEKGQEGSFLTFTKEMGLSNPTIYFMPTFLPREEELSLDSIEFHITHIVNYSTFSMDIEDLFRIREALQLCLLNDYGAFIGESVTCQLSKINRFTGFLSEFKISVLTGKLKENPIIFASDKITIMGPLNSEVLRLLKKAITFYY